MFVIVPTVWLNVVLGVVIFCCILLLKVSSFNYLTHIPILMGAMLWHKT